jgi:allophanate hydrolase
LPSSAIGAFSQFIPAPLGLGRVRLADGSDVTGFIGEPLATEGATDITEFGAWRAYLASL